MNGRCGIRYPTGPGSGPHGLAEAVCGKAIRGWMVLCGEHYQDLVRSAPGLALAVRQTGAHTMERQSAVAMATSHLEARERLRYEERLR